MIVNVFHCLRTPSTACGRSTRSARPRGLGGDFEFLPLKSPRNPITPFETSRVATLHPWLLKRSLEDMRHRLSEKSTFTLHMLHMLHMSDMLKENDIRRKSNRGGKSEGLNNISGRAMRAPTTWLEIATVRCVCNAGLHHCNGQMYLQPSVAPSYTVGARIARPFVPDVITAIFRAGARRVIGATAKPLYAIDSKAERP